MAFASAGSPQNPETLYFRIFSWDLLILQALAPVMPLLTTLHKEGSPSLTNFLGQYLNSLHGT